MPQSQEMHRPVLRRAVRTEWGPLLRTVRNGLGERGLRAIPITIASVCLTLLLQIAQNQSWGYGLVQELGSVHAHDPLWLTLLRTLLSLFVPALDLPVWGALAQILVVFGICEICLGGPRTLAIAYAATLAGTMYAHLGVRLGPDGPLGLPTSAAYLNDSGPSAAVVGLAVFVCWRYRARLTCGLVVAAMVVEVLFIKCNLAGKEHVVAVLGVLALCGLMEHLQHRNSVSGRSARFSGPGSA